MSDVQGKDLPSDISLGRAQDRHMCVAARCGQRAVSHWKRFTTQKQSKRLGTDRRRVLNSQDNSRLEVKQNEKKKKTKQISTNTGG